MKTMSRASTAVLVVLAVIASLFAAASPASALPYRVGYAVSYSGDTHTVGVLDSRPGSNSNRTICIESRWSAPTSVSSPVAVNDPKIAYMLWKYINQTSSNPTGAALAYAVKSKYEVSTSVTFWQGVWSSFRTTQSANYNATMSAYNTMNAEATRLAGPYTIPVDVTGNPATLTGTVTGVGVRTGSGAYYPSVPITLTMTGPGVFSANNAKTITVTSTTAAQSIPWKFVPGQSGPVKVSASTSAVLPPSTFYRYAKSSSSTQTMVTLSTTRQRASGLDPTGFLVSSVASTSAVADPVISTTPVNTGTVSDTVNITGGVAGASATITSTLYGPLAALPTESAAAPAGTPVFDTVTQTATLSSTGTATVTMTSSLAPTAPGYYVWREAVSGAAGTYASTFGRLSETFLLSGAGTVSTTISNQSASTGDTITDTVRVTGLKAMPGTDLAYSVTGSLYGPVDPVNGSCAGIDWSGAPVAATIPATSVPSNGIMSGLGSYTIPVDGAGCYSYAETLTATQGGQTLWSVDHAVGQASQTTLATSPAPGDLTVATQISSQQVLLGVPITDSVTITGLDAAKLTNDTTTARFEGSLLGPLDPVNDTCEGLDWADAPVALTFGPIDVEADGTITGVGAYTPTAYGCYTYTERVTESWSDGIEDHSKVFNHAPGKVSQTTVVSAPDYPAATVATQVSDTLIFEGATISDTVTLTGVKTFTGQTTPDVVTTLSGSLLGPLAPVDGACVDLDWTDAPVAATIDPMVVTEDGNIAGLGEFTVPAGGAGCYTYTETLDAKQGSTTLWTVVHEAGLAPQTSLAMPLPSVSTEVNAQAAFVGATLSDTATVSGLPDQATITATLSGSLLGPMPPVDEACGQVNWEQAPVAASIDPVEVTEDGDITGLGEFTVSEAGCYTYTETLTLTEDDGTVTVVNHEPGLVSQTSLVSPAPAISTTVSAQKATIGDTLTDEVSVTGLVWRDGVTYTLGGSLLGPVSPVDGACAELDWADAPVAAEIAPMVLTQDTDLSKVGSFTVKVAGCYTYTENLTVDDEGQPSFVVDHAPGQESQTSLVSAASKGAGNTGGGEIHSGDPVLSFGLTSLAALLLLAAAVLAASSGRRQEV